jgi:hypothetical protein
MRLEDRTLLSLGPISQFPVPDVPPPAQGPQIGLPPAGPPASINVGKVFEGIDYLGSNCGCYPPDTNAAVGGTYVVETVNVEMRVFDKTSGSVLLDEPLSSVFGGASTGGDPYVVYDDIANQWYISAFDSSDTGLFLAVSKDGNPLDGFLTTYDLTNVGGSPDYAKMGFNNDAIFISYNDFGAGGGNAAIAAINKADALSGTLTYNVSAPAPEFRAMPPAQMHGDSTGGTEWFISTDGSDTGGSTIRVTKMTNYLSASPNFTYYSLPVQQYKAPKFSAVQPGGTVTVFPNTTTTQVDFRNGLMVTTLGTADSSDKFGYEHAHWYEVSLASGTPTLAHEGVVNPGRAVTAQMPSAALNSEGKIGLTWIQSSKKEYVSMYVGTVDPATGALSSAVAKKGLSFMAVNGRIGDYSSVVLDPTTDTFWAANEYIGANGGSDIWNTAVAGFTFSATPSQPSISVNDDGASPTGGSAAMGAIAPTSLPISSPFLYLASGSQSGLSTSGLEQQVEALVWDQVVFQKNRKSTTS